MNNFVFSFISPFFQRLKSKTHIYQNMGDEILSQLFNQLQRINLCIPVKNVSYSWQGISCLTPYKFYLAFENSNCKEYITEKLWHNALENNVVPIVMGASKKHYESVAPPGSFIHVDDFKSPHDLARYLKILHKDKRLYNQYFKWKVFGRSVTEIDEHPTKSKFWCDLCHALHDKLRPHKSHLDLDKWWTIQNQCQIK